MASEPRALTLREMNRALLARQMLLRRERVGVVAAIERLGALQAQWPRAPYVGLWSRLEGFERTDLEKALTSRRVVKAQLMRGTLHLVSARDYPYYAVATPEARRALWQSTQRQLVAFFAKENAAVRRFAEEGRAPVTDAAKLHEILLRHAATPRSRGELVAFIATRAKIPLDLATHLVWGFIAAFGMLVHAPESALLSANRAGDVVAARVALRNMKVPAFAAAVRHTVKRHLAAFGPATLDDVSSWTSIRTPPLREAIARLGQVVRVFRDERGRTLYDLAAAHRPPADTSAPARYLPKWDSMLLAYTPAERVRILPDAHRRAVIGKNGDVAQTILLDGLVGGTWAVSHKGREAIVEVTPFRALRGADRTALVDEGERLARFIAPDATTHGVRA